MDQFIVVQCVNIAKFEATKPFLDQSSCDILSQIFQIIQNEKKINNKYADLKKEVAGGRWQDHSPLRSQCLKLDQVVAVFMTAHKAGGC